MNPWVPPAAAARDRATSTRAPADAGRAARLLARCEKQLETSCSAPLLAAMAAGTVDPVTFGRYLVIEYDFVQTAARVAAWCVWAEPVWARAVAHAEAVTDLVGAQEAQLAGLRQLWPVEADHLPGLRRRAAPLTATLQGCLRRGGYPAVVTSLAAAESLYLRWCAAASDPPRMRSAAVQGWIDAHTSPAFLTRVSFLHSLVDAIPDEVLDAQLDEWFTAMLAAEDTFHAAASHR